MNSLISERAAISRAIRATPPMVPICLTALLLIASDVLANGGDSDEHGFVGVKKCKTCHKKKAIGNQYGAWLDTKHATAFETLAGEQAAEWAAEAGVDGTKTGFDFEQAKEEIAHSVPEGYDPTAEGEAD